GRPLRLRCRVVRLREQPGARPASGGVVTLPALRAAENTERRFTAPRPQTDTSHAAESLSQDPEPTALPSPSRWSRTSVATLPPRLRARSQAFRGLVCPWSARAPPTDHALLTDF